MSDRLKNQIRIILADKASLEDAVQHYDLGDAKNFFRMAAVALIEAKRRGRRVMLPIRIEEGI